MSALSFTDGTCACFTGGTCACFTGGTCACFTDWRDSSCVTGGTHACLLLLVGLVNVLLTGLVHVLLVGLVTFYWWDSCMPVFAGGICSRKHYMHGLVHVNKSVCLYFIMLCVRRYIY